MLIVGGGVTALSAVVVGGVTAGIGIGGFGWMLARAAQTLISGNPEQVVAKIRSDAGSVMQVRRRHLGETMLGRTPDGALSIDLRFKNGHAEFTGREAERIAAVVIPKVNRFGGDKQAVAEAVSEIESTGGAEGYLDHLTQLSGSMTQRRAKGAKKWWQDGGEKNLQHGLFGLPRQHRLALEMALHEEAERRAAQGELAELERAWKDAEEIAGIADSLLLPDSVDETMARMRREQGLESEKNSESR
jgi:hypothetical protein